MGGKNTARLGCSNPLARKREPKYRLSPDTADPVTSVKLMNFRAGASVEALLRAHIDAYKALHQLRLQV